jgi:hypothetical protein
VTARTDQRAQAIDQEFAQLAEWIGQGRAPISQPLADVLGAQVGHRACRQPATGAGPEASAFAKQRFQERLTRPDGSHASSLSAWPTAPFDDNGRLLAYVAPNGAVAFAVTAFE